jgi:dTDP-4-dehydrorhamnose 3,5-epimerase
LVRRGIQSINFCGCRIIVALRTRQPVFLGKRSASGPPLVRVLSGHIWDVAVDLRRESPDFGKWAGFDLKAESSADHLQLLWIPEGFAHGFLVLSDTAEVLYKTTNTYHPQGERSIVWNDPTLAIDWPLEALNGIPPSVSPKDALGKHFLGAELPPVEVPHLV